MKLLDLSRLSESIDAACHKFLDKCSSGARCTEVARISAAYSRISRWTVWSSLALHNPGDQANLLVDRECVIRPVRLRRWLPRGRRSSVCDSSCVVAIEAGLLHIHQDVTQLEREVCALPQKQYLLERVSSWRNSPVCTRSRTSDRTAASRNSLILDNFTMLKRLSERISMNSQRTSLTDPGEALWFFVSISITNCDTTTSN